MPRTVHDHALPPDHAAFVAAKPSNGRVIVIAATRAACETIELGLRLHVDTVLERQHGEEIRSLARSRTGFGIVAGTGTGKTLSIRPIAEEILGTAELRVGVVNREREATPETPTWSVIIITTGIARRWFEDGDILRGDTLIVDEIHQTSAELELCLALGRRVGCRFIWLSATVDPEFYAAYLRSGAVIESAAFDPERAARVRVVRQDPPAFLNDRFLQGVVKRRRGVGLFLPTRASVEGAAAAVAGRFPRITAAFYHGGEPIRVIRPFLEDGVNKPFLLAMTAAGQSALNVKGLDTVVIDDTRFANVVQGGRNVLTRLHLGANEILQMAGRVHGRVADGEVFILSDRDIDFFALEPVAPEFQLAGDSERIALTCASLGVRADELDLPVPLDRLAYRRAVAELETRGLISGGRLTRYGELVAAAPVERPWAELLVNADDSLVPCLAVMASIESLHRMTREDRRLEGLIVPGSDHLTAYNLYAEAFAKAGYIGRVYGLARHLFDEDTIERWAERRGVLVKAIEDAALAVASICRSLEIDLPAFLPRTNEQIEKAFIELVARIMPFDLVIDQETADGQEARVSRTSVCGSWGPIAGTLRYFADRFGIPRASIEGTQLPLSVVRRHASAEPGELVLDTHGKRDVLIRRNRVTYFGFELQREDEETDRFPEGTEGQARRVLAEALATGTSHHPAVRRYRQAIEESRELYRRSGGALPRLDLAALTTMYEHALEGVGSMRDFRSAPIALSVPTTVPAGTRERLSDLPDAVEIRGKWIRLEYDVEDADGAPAGIVRLRLPERLATLLTAQDVPRFDRPVRFAVTRDHGRAVHAATLEELREALSRPPANDAVPSQRSERRPDVRQDRSRQDRSRQDRSRQDRSRQDRSRQDRSRQDRSRRGGRGRGRGNR